MAGVRRCYCDGIFKVDGVPAMKPATVRPYLESLVRSGHLSAEAFDTALRRLGLVPGPADWRRFAGQFLLATGSLLLLAGVLFFFAFNWAVLHRFVKILLVALPLLVSAVGAMRYGLNSAAGKAGITSAVVLTGILLAVIGQIYQTGADSEMLFAGWAVLTLPWVVLAVMPWLGVFWLLLVNAALVLFIAGRLDVWALFFHDGLLWMPFLFNALALMLWEALWPRCEPLRAAYGPRFIAFAAIACISGLAVCWWFVGDHSDWRLLHYVPPVYLAFLTLTLWFYQHRRRDIVPLAAASLSLIVVLTSGLIKGLFEHRNFDVSGFFLVGVAVAGMTAGAALWLRRTSSSWEQVGRARDV